MTDHVAVIGGTGDLGFALATRWAKAGIKVTIGSRDKAKAEDAVQRLKEIIPDANVDGLENAAAAGSSSTVVVAVPFSGFVPIYRSIAESLQDNAVVIDATVPVAASPSFRKERRCAPRSTHCRRRPSATSSHRSRATSSCAAANSARKR
jgi:NADPH-dependent F420 reductase